MAPVRVRSVHSNKASAIKPWETPVVILQRNLDVTEEQRAKGLPKFVCYTVQPLYNEVLYNDTLGITNDFVFNPLLLIVNHL